jgi:hypothetical protein
MKPNLNNLKTMLGINRPTVSRYNGLTKSLCREAFLRVYMGNIQ